MIDLHHASDKPVTERVQHLDESDVAGGMVASTVLPI